MNPDQEDKAFCLYRHGGDGMVFDDKMVKTKRPDRTETDFSSP